MKIAGFGTDIAQWFGLGPEMVFIDPKTDTLTSPWYQDHIKDYISYMNSLSTGVFIGSDGSISRQE